MTDQERLLLNFHKSDIAWAKTAWEQTLETLLFNQLLVAKGLWPTLISKMTSEDELDIYSSFVVGLKGLYSTSNKKNTSRSA